MTEFSTCELSDAHGDAVRIAAPIFRSFGGLSRFWGEIATLKLYEDNGLVREMLAENGNGRVLVVDGGGSLRCALLGDRLAQMAVDNGWAGVVVWGCIRDVEAIARLPLGVLALAPHPRRTVKKSLGERQIPVEFAGIVFRPGEWLYADADGLLVSSQRLTSK
ncbi:MAG: ribonuclease E activity regulator RraA [Rhodocyclaceae bacterium]|nr:ribonuclease E activity regulator RraA [Rhodocyclaceae bacterium]